MKSTMVSPAGTVFEKDFSDQEYQDAIAKGYKPAVDLVSPKGAKYTLAEDDPRLGEALKTGHKTQAQVDAQNEKIEVGPGEAAVRGFANAGTLGFVDEISGAGGAIKDAWRKGTLKDVGSDYSNNRDRYREQDDAAYDQNKLAYGAGYGVGSIATAVLAPAASSIKGAAAIGAGLGALGSAGGGTDVGQTDLTKGQYGDFAKQVGMGAALGGALGGATQSIVKPEAAGDLSKYFAYRSTGGLKSDINKLYSTTPKEVGQTLLDEGVIPTFGRRGGDEIKGNVQNAVNKYSDKNDEILSQLDKTGGFDVDRFIAKVSGEIDTAKKSPSLDVKKYGENLQERLDAYKDSFISKVRNEIETARKNPNPQYQTYAEDLSDRLSQYLKPKNVSDTQNGGGLIDLLTDSNENLTKNPLTQSFQQTVDDRRLLQDAAKYRPSVDNTANEAAKKISSLLNESIDEQAGNRLGKDFADQYQANRFQQKKLLDADRAIGQSQQREQANKLLGITDYSVLGGGGAASLATANPGVGLATIGAVGAKKLAENYGDAFAANVLSKAAKVIDNYGLDEGSRRLANVLGAETAAKIVRQLQEKK